MNRARKALKYFCKAILTLALIALLGSFGGLLAYHRPVLCGILVVLLIIGVCWHFAGLDGAP